jgi:hypothetical protein
MGNQCDPFDADFANYLDGLLISDGFVSRHSGMSPCSTYSQTCTNKEWLEVIQGRFQQNGISSKIGTSREENYLITLCYDQLGKQRDRWYKDDIKRVPTDIDVTNRSLLRNWIYGDGTLVNNTTLRLCTDSFVAEDIEFLKQQLNSKLNVCFKEILMGYTKTGEEKIRLALSVKNGLDAFYNYLGTCDCNCFSYKWR